MVVKCFANDQRIGILANFLGAERGMEATHDHRHAPPAKLAGNLIRPPGRVGFDTDGDQVRGLVEGDGLEPIVVEALLNLGGRERGDCGGGKALHQPGADVPLHAARATDAGMDDGQSERAAHGSDKHLACLNLVICVASNILDDGVRVLQP
jgi:hypothetical protein